MQYDVAVIGGGPAGMMAAGRAAELGARVVLLEKNPTLGKKLLITGGGRCNVTNAEFDEHILLGKFKENKKFLFSPFSRFTVQQTLDFFTSRNMPIKIETQKRAFPVSNSAQSVWDVLVAYMQQHNVKVITDSPADGFEFADEIITGIRMKNKTIVRAATYIIATGGKSRPKTGSTGEGFQWLKKIGHTIIEPDPALVPVKIHETWVHKLSGLTLKDVKLTAFQNQKKQVSNKGSMIFTHFGISGPLVLNMSRDISELLKYGTATLEIDLAPQTDIGTLDKELLVALGEHTNKKIKNSLGKFIAPTLAPILLELAQIDPETFVHSIHREERLRITTLLKHLPMTVSGILGPEKAIVTSGGVELSEIDFQTMQSKIAHNLYVIGDVLNIDRPSGGYSLQLCWTTGQVAGTHAAKSSVSSTRT